MKTIPLLALLLLLAPQLSTNGVAAQDPAETLTEACIAVSGLPPWDASVDNGLGAWQFSDDCRALYGVPRSPVSASVAPRSEAWLAMYRHAQYIVSGSLPSACAETPEGWVESLDLLPANTHAISCGNTVLTFYAH